MLKQHRYMSGIYILLSIACRIIKRNYVRNLIYIASRVINVYLRLHFPHYQCLQLFPILVIMQNLQVTRYAFYGRFIACIFQITNVIPLLNNFSTTLMSTVDNPLYMSVCNYFLSKESKTYLILIIYFVPYFRIKDILVCNYNYNSCFTTQLQE